MFRRIHLHFHINKRFHQNLAVKSSNFPSTSSKRHDLYDPELKLVAELNKPLDINVKLNSPFILAEKTTDDYMELLHEQIAIEESCFTKILNMTRKSTLEPVERLIERWDWKEQIKEKLNHVISNAEMSRELMSYFSKIDTEECAEQLISFLQAILCRGQRSVPVSEFNNILPRIILNLQATPFFRLMSDDHKRTLEKVFPEYIKYYTDDRIARSYTIRDWWAKSAASVGLTPTRHSLIETFNIPVKEISNMLISFFVQCCEFPPYNGKKADEKRNMTRVRWGPAFSIKDVPIFELNPHAVGKKTDLCKMLEIHPQISDGYCQRHQFEYLYFPSHLLPMKVPPRPWMDRGRCGPNYLFKQNMVRKLEEYPDMDVNAEILGRRIRNRMQARPVFDALNLLGATPWRINEQMLAHFMTALEMSYDQSKADFLKRVEIPRHPKSIWITYDFNKFKERFRKRKGISEEAANDPLIAKEMEKEMAKEHDNYKEKMMKWRNEQNSLWCWLMYRLILAKHFAGGQIIYFPHNIDFRGRTYPISPQINHMGDDINRGLLKFAKGKILGEHGFRWLKLHCINIAGKMKRSPLRDRLKYAEANIDKIIDSAERPFNGDGWWWKESEEPWQTLATCIEIRDALKGGDPLKFCSHLPIHQDGSCNGLQHYAALGRDLEGAREVNLLPEDRPQDIYTTVVERVERKRVEDEQSESWTTADEEKFHNIALALRKHIKGPLERKIVKQTVMTTVYGVTNYGAREQIKRQLIAIGIPDAEASSFSNYLAKRTLDGLTDAFTNSTSLMKWFKDCAGQILKLKQSVEWETPLGLPVIQPYVEIEKVDGALGFHPVPHKQKNAFPPNFIHSLDSTHMMLTALHCYRHGITYAAVHDCFWTHACDVDEMNRICRDQFVALHEQPIVEQLSKSFRSTYLTDELREKMPPKMMQKMEETFKPTMKPGDLDINEVRKSTYFFS